MHHYRRLSDVFTEEILGRILHESIELEEICDGDSCFTIRMAFSRPWDEGGELSLSFEVNGNMVFLLSFTIIPGWVVQSESNEVVLISTMQGVRGCRNDIRRATRALHGIAPPFLLLAALRGVARAFGVNAMAGVNAAMKPEFHFLPEEEGHIQEAYDEFFALLGATKGPAGFYLSPLPPPERPIETIKSKKRRGHKTRMAIKREIAQRVYQRLCDLNEKFPEFGHQRTNGEFGSPK